jgi:glycosyltransferase involved in cell wall biosynthesis
MKALHVIPAIAARYGGPSQAVRLLCHALSEQPDLQVELVTTDADGSCQRISSSQVPQGYPVHVFRRTLSERWKYSGQMAGWLKNHVREFDIVHIHALWTHSTFAAARAAQRAGIPYIIRPAGMLSKYSLGHRSWIKRFSWMLSERGTVAGAAAFQATTEPEADDIRQVWPSADVVVIPNGVDDSAFTVRPDRNSLRSLLLKSLAERPILLFLSRLHPKKGIVDLLLPALAAMTDRPLLVIAGGADDHDPGYATLVKQTITSLGLQNDVRLWGEVKGPDRWALFDAADLFVLPSHSENFGIVVAEAMARGCAVLITDQVQICDHVGRAECGVIVTVDIDALTSSIKNLLSDLGELHSKGLRGRQYAQNHFSWIAVANDVKRMYTEVIYSSTRKNVPIEFLSMPQNTSVKERL